MLEGDREPRAPADAARSGAPLSVGVGRLEFTAMTIEIGQIEAIFRYPVKSMAGGRLEAANLGWHGLDGDRRLAFRRARDHSGVPWLTASRLPDLLRFTPIWREQGVRADLPAH